MTNLFHRVIRFSCTFVFALFLAFIGKAQDSTAFDKLVSFPDKVFRLLDNKASRLQYKIDKQTDKYLHALERQERKVQRLLSKKDSAAATQLFATGIREEFNKSNHQLSSSFYSGHLDSLTTAISFLRQADSASGIYNKALEDYKSLQSKFRLSEELNTIVRDRQRVIYARLQQFGMIKHFQKLKKAIYYYQSQIREYKQLIEDPSKLEAKLLELVSRSPQFKEYFAANSVLASLFPMPVSGSAATAGLQTRAMVNQGIAARYGSGADVQQMIQQNLQAAQSQLNQLKDLVNKYSSGTFGNTNSDINIPDFKINTQKTKSFLKRLELGSNLQSQKAKYFFPITTDIGVSVGYRLTDKNVVGIGACGKVGWGRGWDNMKLSFEGLGLRSFLDYKFKKSLYISGGFEMNYRPAINSVQQLRDYSSWQRSGLIGLSKKYTVVKKIKGELKVLWDFLSYQQVPRTEPIIFRIGYCFK
jgi:hypothetical protein